MDEYRLAVGDVVIGIECRQAGLAAGLATWFGAPSAAAAPHVTLDLEIVPHAGTPALPRSLLTTKKLLPDGGFDIADGLITGRYDRAARRGEVRAKGILVTGRPTRVLEQLFYQTYHTARAVAGSEGWLVHSSAAIVDGRGYLFVGPSGSGKSTVAGLSAGRHVLGDEMNLVIPTPAGMDVAGTLFNGTFRDRRPGRAPLAGIYLLEHAAQHRVSEAPDAAAASVLAGEIVPPVGLDEAPGPGTLPAMVDAALAMAAQSGLKRLEFLPDAGFWNVILDPGARPGSSLPSAP